MLFSTCWWHLVSPTCWESHLSDSYKTRHLKCCRHGLLIHVGASWAALEISQKDPSLHSGFSQLWDSLCSRYWAWFGGLHKFRLGGWFLGSQVYFRFNFSLGSGPIFWSRKKQSAIALSSTEAKYRGAMNATTEVIWLQNILTKFGIQIKWPSIIFCDN